MPQYMLLIYNPVDSPMTPEQMAELGPRWDAYTQSLTDAGVFVKSSGRKRVPPMLASETSSVWVR